MAADTPGVWGMLPFPRRQNLTPGGGGQIEAHRQMVAVTGVTGTLCLYPVFPSETAEVTVCFCFGVPFYFLFVSDPRR